MQPITRRKVHQHTDREVREGRVGRQGVGVVILHAFLTLKKAADKTRGAEATEKAELLHTKHT